jgi:type VI secretion system protein ImpH
MSENASTGNEALGEFWQRIAEEPWAFDLFPALRRIDAAHPELPRLGRAHRPSQEPVRIGQLADMSFAPSSIAKVEAPTEERPARLRILSFGLWGPNGPMPTALTEYVRERELVVGDRTPGAFADIFHHRLSLLFYRAWADAQPTVSLDQPGEDDFSRYVASLLGYGLPSQAGRDAVPDHARWHVAGHLVRQTRNPEGLACILGDYFKTRVEVLEFVGKWLPLAPDQRTRLGSREGQLGRGALIGCAVWDRQHSFRLRIGPLVLTDYESFLPGGAWMEQMLAWVRTWVGREFAWDLQLVLAREEVPAMSLGGRAKLGWTSWLGGRRRTSDASELILDVESLAEKSGRLKRAADRVDV